MASTVEKAAIQTGGAAVGAAIGSIVPGVGTLLGSFIGGGIGTFINSLIGSSEEEDARNQYLALAEQQATEVLARQHLNEAIMTEQAWMGYEDIAGKAGAMGRGSISMGAQIETARALSQNINIARREAEYEAKMVRLQAQYNAESSERRSDAAVVGAVGSLLDKAVDVYARKDYYTKNAPKSLGGSR